MADIRVSDKLIKLVGQNLYSASSHFPRNCSRATTKLCRCSKGEGRNCAYPVLYCHGFTQ